MEETNTTVTATQVKITKTEESILKLERHLKNKTCPLQGKAKANIKPDELFTKEIVSIKRGAELYLLML